MDVLIYTMEGCPFCEQAKCLLVRNGLEFTEKTAPPGSEGWREMQEKTGGATLPQVLIDGEPVGGYADLVNQEATGELHKKLKLAHGEAALYDVVIVGAGPAGLSAAIYAIRKMLKTVIISKDIGGQVTWTNEVENYLGFSQVNASELVSKFDDHVKRFGVEKVVGVGVTAIDLARRIKRVYTSDGKCYLGKTLIIATGGGHKPMNIPGERELVGKGLSYCSTCDAPLFDGADVAVIGGGNSGLEAVLDLMQIANKIYLISMLPLQGDPVYQEKIRQSDKVEILVEHIPEKVYGEKFVTGIEVKSLKTGDLRVLDVEGIFVEIGILPNSGVFIDTLATNGKGEILVDTECRTGLAGVFACGDVTNVPFKQVVVAVGEGAKAALSAYSYLLNLK